MRRLALAGAAVLLCALTGCSNPQARCDLTALSEYEAIHDEAAAAGDDMTPDALAEYGRREQAVTDDISALELSGQLDRYRDIHVQASEEWQVLISDPTN